jgi:hypothetical protein
MASPIAGERLAGVNRLSAGGGATREANGDARGSLEFPDSLARPDNPDRDDAINRVYQGEPVEHESFGRAASTTYGYTPDRRSGGKPRAWFQTRLSAALTRSTAAVKSGITSSASILSPDDNQGDVGVVEFQGDGAIAAMSARASGRVLEHAEAIKQAPPELRDSLSHICELQPLQEGLKVSEIFWTVEEYIQGPESWDDICQYGAALFERELLSDSEWEEIGIPFYDLTPDVARLVITISARAMVRVPILQLSEHELTLLVPESSKHESAAIDLLISDGLFEIG